MDVDQAHALTVPLTAAERDQVQRAAAASGQSAEEFMRCAVLTAAADPFVAALERAADTIAVRAERIQHDYADAVRPGYAKGPDIDGGCDAGPFASR